MVKRLLLGIAMLASCGGENVDDLEVETSEIVNGLLPSSNPFNAAIYHWVDGNVCGSWYTGWYPRPCSGTVVRRRNGLGSYILTARHCVTTDGTPNGPLLPSGTGYLTVTTDLNPGLTTAAGPPPGETALLVQAGTPTSATDRAQDVALLKVDSVLPLSNQRFAVHRTGLSGLSNSTVRVWGYGRNVLGNCDGDQSSGAGRLRYADGFTIQSIYNGVLNYAQPNPSNQYLWHGDSGGGSFTSNPLELVGVHSAGTDTAAADAAWPGKSLGDWLESKMGYSFLARRTDLSTTSNVVGVSSTADGSAVYHNRQGETTLNHVTYTAATRNLKVAGKCVQENGVGAAVTIQACNSSSAQLWTLLDNRGIRSDSGRYLYGASDGRILGSNGLFTTEGTWVWLTSP